MQAEENRHRQDGTQHRSRRWDQAHCTADTCSKSTSREQAKIRGRGSLQELGCLAANDPRFEAPYSFENLVIDDAVLVVVWSWNEVFNRRQEVREAPAHDYKVYIDELVDGMNQWRHCMLVGPGD